MAEKFDPKAHVGQFKGRPYMEVKDRLVWLDADQAHFDIQTEVLRFDEGAALIRATVTLLDADGKVLRRATGHGGATKASTQNLGGRFIEKAETSAVGRALAHLGYGTQYAVELEDAADEHLADAPLTPKSTPARQAQAPPASSAAPSTAGAATPAGALAGGAFVPLSDDQLTVLYDKIAAATGYRPTDVAAFLGRPINDHLAALHLAGTPKTGKDLIADLIALKRERRPIPGALPLGHPDRRPALVPTPA